MHSHIITNKEYFSFPLFLKFQTHAVAGTKNYDFLSFLNALANILNSLCVYFLAFGISLQFICLISFLSSNHGK